MGMALEKQDQHTSRTAALHHLQAQDPDFEGYRNIERPSRYNSTPSFAARLLQSRGESKSGVSDIRWVARIFD